MFMVSPFPTPNLDDAARLGVARMVTSILPHLQGKATTQRCRSGVIAVDSWRGGSVSIRRARVRPRREEDECVRRYVIAVPGRKGSRIERYRRRIGEALTGSAPELETSWQ